jgi:glycosyltransferase involved in cell wall biosynthesis
MSIYSHVTESKTNAEIIIVDAISSDNTAQIVSRFITGWKEDNLLNSYLLNIRIFENRRHIFELLHIGAVNAIGDILVFIPVDVQMVSLN